MNGFTKIGQIRPKASAEISHSRIGLGFEKLDRDLYDAEKAYPFLARSGVKWARLQSGWQRCEQQRGVYNFEWLDTIVDNMLRVGVQPWLCLCYGNGLYTEKAREVFGGVGCPPIATEEEKAAWKNYVTATAQHFKGRIHYYEVWNEPDGVWCWKSGPDAVTLARFINDTALACKSGDPSCEVIGLCTCLADEQFHKTLCEHGALENVDAISYHAYLKQGCEINSQAFRESYAFYDNLRQTYKPSLKIIQGESGAQSRDDGCGALAGAAWTEEKQVKYLLRHLITDLSLGVEFTSYFSCMDMAEALNGTVGDEASIRDFGYFGVVAAEFDETARATGAYHEKPSFCALQTLASIMCEEYRPEDIDITSVVEHSQKMYGYNFDFAKADHAFFRRENGSAALFYWNDKNIITETYEGETSFVIQKADVSGEVRLIDMRNGDIYSPSAERVFEEDGKYHFRNMPISDMPMLITIGDFYYE